MKRKMILGLAMSVLLAACSAKIESGSSDDAPQAPQSVWPEMKTSAMAGQVFGSNWAAKTAVFDPAQNDPELISVRIYGQVLDKPCGGGNVLPGDPYITVMLPKNLETKEYVTDILAQQGTMPAVFARFFPVENLIAEKTKVSVKSVDAKGFQALIYAEAYDPASGVSQVNGAIDVINCNAPANFAVWTDLIENYDLTQFDGRNVNPQYTRISWDNSSISDPATGQFRKMLDIPLFYSVGANTSANYNFGPIDGLGVSTFKDDGIYKTYTYKYAGPVRVDGQNVQLNLDVTVKKSSSSTEVKYTIEVPNFIKKDSHSFVLKKPFQ